VSPHGAALLEYVVADMEAAGQPVAHTHEDPPPEGRGAARVPLVTAP
jgi:hypothetical protein